MNNIVKNHKDYCMDIIYYNLHGYAVFGGLVREERRFELLACGSKVIVGFRNLMDRKIFVHFGKRMKGVSA